MFVGRGWRAVCALLPAVFVAEQARPERVEVAGWVEPMLPFGCGDDGEEGQP